MLGVSRCHSDSQIVLILKLDIYNSFLEEDEGEEEAEEEEEGEEYCPFLTAKLETHQLSPLLNIYGEVAVNIVSPEQRKGS